MDEKEQEEHLKISSDPAAITSLQKTHRIQFRYEKVVKKVVLNIEKMKKTKKLDKTETKVGASGAGDEGSGN